MKTPKDFDYDIWKDDDGHYFIRVKRTGEVTRVSEEVVRELWMELYRMDKYRKDTTITEADGSQHSRLFSLDDSWAANPELRPTKNEPWLFSRENSFEDIELEMLERDFLRMLPERQKIIYQLRFKQGFTLEECAARIGTSRRNVDSLIRKIRKKAKLFFEGGSQNAQKSSFD